MLVVTLSSIPPRFDKIGPALDCLLAQQHKPDEIRLYIPKRYRRFPEWDGSLPDVPQGISIHRVEEDLGPATKILPAVQDFSGEDVDLLFCDDDRAYPPDWSAIYAKMRQAHPGAALCRIGRHAETMAESEGLDRRLPRAVRRWRITDWRFQLHFLRLQMQAGRDWRAVRAPDRLVYKRSGYIDIFEGCGGVVVRPEFFDEEAYEIPPVLWTVDDVWLSGMVAKNDVPIWIEANLLDPPETEVYSTAALATSVIEGANREQANAMAVKYMQDTYGIWR